MKGEIITKDNYPEIYDWLSENIHYYENKEDRFTLTDDKKINAYCDVSFYVRITEIKYPFGYVKGHFNCWDCKSLMSFIGFPGKIEGSFDCDNCKNLNTLIGFPKHIRSNIFFRDNNFSNDPKHKEKYKLYIAMWLELLESVSEDDKCEYINNYQNKLDYHFKLPIIPKEVINRYKIDFLLNEK